MKIVVTEDAANWYKQELHLKDNDSLRFFVRYGGFGGQIPGFSLGVSEESPIQVHASTTVNKITFFIEEADEWYFEDKNLHINFYIEHHESKFLYIFLFLFYKLCC